MRFVAGLKRATNRALVRRGYRIERILDYGPWQLNVFELIVTMMHPEDRGFFVLQVGAHDGRRGDPLRRLIERYRWRGLLAEPQPQVFAALRATYSDQPQLILENAAVAAADGTQAFYTAAGASLRGTFDGAALRRHFGRSRPIAQLTVRTVTFRTLVSQYAIDRVDVAVIDTEGFDYELVKLMLADGLTPRLLQYEHLHLSQGDRRACAALLARNRYRLLRNGTDTIALRESEAANELLHA